MTLSALAQRKYLWTVFFVLTAVGVLDSAYLTLEHFRGGIPLCGLDDGCSLVLTSQYAEWYGVPTAVLGLAFYLTLVLLGVWHARSGRRLVLHLLTTVAALGFLASLGFVYLQLAVIRAICLYCMVSATSATILLLLGGILQLSGRSGVTPEAPDHRQAEATEAPRYGQTEL